MGPRYCGPPGLHAHPEWALNGPALLTPFSFNQNQSVNQLCWVCLTEIQTYEFVSLAYVRPLVTSFTGKYGSIQYCVRAVLERPRAPDQSVRREIQVLSHMDVNTPALLVSSFLPVCLLPPSFQQPRPHVASLVLVCPVTF